jgi:hypothetical protein
LYSWASSGNSTCKQRQQPSNARSKQAKAVAAAASTASKQHACKQVTSIAKQSMAIASKHQAAWRQAKASKCDCGRRVGLKGAHSSALGC